MSTPQHYSGSRFRAALLHYVLGRGLNALLAIGLFVALARALPVSAYAAYVALWALTELLLAVGNLGTEWVTASEVPRLRQAQQGRALRRLVGAMLLVQAAAFGLLALLWYWCDRPLAGALGLAQDPALALFAATLFIEGISRSVRDQMLSNLLLQWVAQAGQAFRNGAVLLYLSMSALAGQGVALIDIVQCEVGAALAALLFSGGYLARVLARLPREAAVEPLPWSEFARRAFWAWLGGLGALLLSAQTALLLIGRAAGAEAGAAAGFARNLAEQVRRFMPIEFGFAIFRTFLLARFAADRSAQKLWLRMQLAWRVNACLLVAALVLCVGFGDEIGSLVSGGRYPAAGHALVFWMLWVLAWSRHRLVDTLAHTLGRSKTVVSTSAALLPALLLLAWAAGSPLPMLAVAVLALCELVYAGVLSRVAPPAARAPAGLMQADWLKLGAAGLPAAALALLLKAHAPALPWWGAATLSAALFVLLATCLRVLRRHEFKVFSESGGLHAELGA